MVSWSGASSRLQVFTGDYHILAPNIAWMYRCVQGMKICRRRLEMESGQRFDHLREHSIGFAQVLFQSITHMAPAAAVAYSLLLSVLNAGPVLPLAVLLALVACLLAANSIGQLAKESNTMVLPASVADVGSMIALAMNVIGRRPNGTAETP